ncbi:MAG: hypothetical protein CL908_25360, partial [Deltaproteobacteria bacterium]|nr:hypothetical protein [Deltaproteobacteria bacterium]
MNRISPTRIAPPREKRWTRSVRLAASLLLLVHSSWAAPVFAAVPLRLAIAPFSTDSTDSTDSSKTTRSGARARGGAGQGLRVAKALTARLALRDL